FVTHSWTPKILPYIEQDNLFRQYRFDINWDANGPPAPGNGGPGGAIREKLAVFLCPSAPQTGRHANRACLDYPATTERNWPTPGGNPFVSAQEAPVVAAGRPPVTGAPRPHRLRPHPPQPRRPRDFCLNQGRTAHPKDAGGVGGPQPPVPHGKRDHRHLDGRPVGEPRQPYPDRRV